MKAKRTRYQDYKLSYSVVAMYCLYLALLAIFEIFIGNFFLWQILQHPILYVVIAACVLTAEEIANTGLRISLGICWGAFAFAKSMELYARYMFAWSLESHFLFAILFLSGYVCTLLFSVADYLLSLWGYNFVYEATSTKDLWKDTIIYVPIFIGVVLVLVWEYWITPENELFWVTF